MAIHPNRRQEPQSSRFEALHGPLYPRGIGVSSPTTPTTGFIDFDSALAPPATRNAGQNLDIPVYASETTIAASEFKRRLCIVIGGFSYSHSVYHAAPASPTGPVDPTSLTTYRVSPAGAVTLGTLGTTFGSHEYWESWEYGIHALDALTQTLDRSGGVNVQIGLFQIGATTPVSPPSAGPLVPSGKSSPAAMPASAATSLGTLPTVSEWTTLFETLNVSPFFGNTNLTQSNKSMFLTIDENLLGGGTVHGKVFGAQVGIIAGGSISSFVGVPTSFGPFTDPFSHGGGPTPPAGQQYLVANYGDRGATLFPNSVAAVPDGVTLGTTLDRDRWWSETFRDPHFADLVYEAGGSGGVTTNQEPHHILYCLANGIIRQCFDMVDKRSFFDRGTVDAQETMMPIQGFPPDAVTATTGTTPGTIEVGWTEHIAAPDDGTRGRWRIYLTADSALIHKVKTLRDKDSLFTVENINNGLKVTNTGPISKIDTPNYVEVIEGLVPGETYYVTMTNVHFNGYLLRSNRGILLTGTAQQGQPHIAESEIFTPGPSAAAGS